MAKSLTLIYCNDGNAAKAVAVELRNSDTLAQCRSAGLFDDVAENVQRVITLPCCTTAEVARIKAAYGEVFTGDAPAALPPLPPVSPLATLVGDWRGWDYGKLRDIAAAVTGRSPDNQKQAVQVLEGLLKANK